MTVKPKAITSLTFAFGALSNSEYLSESNPTYQNGRDVDPDAEKTASATHMLDSNVLKKRDGSKFEALLESVQETSFTAHIVGDGVSFRQIVVAPVVNKDDGAVVIRPRKGNLLNFLIERSNGQLLYLRLIDEIPARLDLNGFIKTIEAVLPVCIEAFFLKC